MQEETVQETKAQELNSSTSYNVEIRVSSSTVHITLVTEYVCCSPKKLDTSLSLLLLKVSYNCLEVSLILLNVCALVNEVNIVEAVVLDTHLLHELETCVNLSLSNLNSVRSCIPRE